MKRELKFRIWNGHEMVYDITTGKFGTFYVNPEKGYGLNPQDTACLTVNTTKYPDEIIPMQFTELKDKTGKEIYEGDIVRIKVHHNYTNTGHRFEPLIKTDVFRNYLVEYKNGDSIYNTIGLFFKPLSKLPDYLELGDKTMEIIGNIYETPELLQS